MGAGFAQEPAGRQNHREQQSDLATLIPEKLSKMAGQGDHFLLLGSSFSNDLSRCRSDFSSLWLLARCNSRGTASPPKNRFTRSPTVLLMTFSGFTAAEKTCA